MNSTAASIGFDYSKSSVPNGAAQERDTSIQFSASEQAAPRPQLSKHPRVLVLGITPNLTWKVARCLQLAGCRPTVLGWHRWSPMQVLPGIDYVHWDGVHWVDGDLSPKLVPQVEAECRSRGIEMVLGADYASIMFLSQHRPFIQAAPVASVPDEHTMRLLHNKWHFSNLLSRLNIPQPRTELASRGDDLLQTRLTFPIITKPVDLWASVGFQMHASHDELSRRVRQGQLGADFPLLVQEFIPGLDIGFAFIADRGRIQSYAGFEHPSKGSRKHFDSPRLLEYVKAVVEHTGYSGVGQVDARYDPAKEEFRLLEVNPRFWASVLYTQRSGMNFPDLLIRPPQAIDQLGFVAQTDSVKLGLKDRATVASLMLAERVFHALED